MIFSTLKLVASFLVLTASARAQTAVLFGASGTVGSEVLKSLLVNSLFDEVILIGRASYPKVDEILSKSKAGSSPNVTTLTLPDLNNLDSTRVGIEKADSCFIAVGVGEIYEVTLRYWHSVEVDLVGSIARFCNGINVRTLTLLSAIDVDHESAAPFTREEIHAEGQRPLGWLRSVYLYFRVKGLEERAVLVNAENVPHIRLFRPSTIVTKESRYGWVDRTIFYIHHLFDSYMPVMYRSVDAKLLGMAMVADAERVLQFSAQQDEPEKVVAKLTYADYVSVAGKLFEEQHGLGGDEL